MRSIYSYLNYRDFLYDFYEEKKTGNPAFSYRLFSDRCGFKSKSFLKHVIEGKKNLSPTSIEKFKTVLKLSPKQFDYFTTLVLFNQARSLAERNDLFEKLSGFNSRNEHKLIIKQQYDFYSRWYHNTIRELVCQGEFDEDYARLGQMCHPAISARDAQQSVQLLLNLKLITKEANGYRQSEPTITTGDEVQSLAVQNFHLQNLNLAGESIDSTPRAERDISALVLGLSAEGFEKAKREIQKFRKSLLQLAAADKELERVYHVNFQLFPTSKPFTREEK